MVTEGALTWLGLGNPDARMDPFIGFTAQSPLFVQQAESDGSQSWVTNENKLLWFNAQNFPHIKGDNVKRVFCFGGSTTFGRPFSDKTSFCGWLRVFLNTADKTNQWEVINVGGVSYASYRVSILMQEIQHYDPDLFIVYSGHNEFLEKRTYSFLADLPGWMLEVLGSVSQTHIYGTLRNILTAPKGATNNTIANTEHSLQQGHAGIDTLDENKAEVSPMLDVADGWNEYRRDKLQREETQKHFGFNLRQMAKLARDAKIQMLWVAPASNLKDISPFKSEPSLKASDSRKQEFSRLMQSVDYQSNAELKIRSLKDALSLDPEYALTHYLYAQSLFAAGDYQAAQTAYLQAMDKDVLPLRITTALDRELHVNAQKESIPVINFPLILKTRMKQEYAHEIIGNEFFLDHVHPTIEGNRMLALSIFQWMVEEGLLNPSEDWGELKITQKTQELITGLDVNDQADALVRLGNVLSWARKADDAFALYQKAYDMTGGSPEVLGPLARTALQLGRNDAAVTLYVNAFGATDKHEEIGLVLQELLLEEGLSAKPQKKAAFLWELLQKIPDNSVINNLYGMELVELGYSIESIQAFGKAVQFSPENIEYRFNLAMSLSEQGRFAEALEHFQRYTVENSDNALAFNNLGVSLTATGRFEEAIPAFSRALELDPTLENARINLQRVTSKVSQMKGR